MPCSTAARERHDPMLGTAPPQQRFLLVEQDSGWAFSGFSSLAIQEDIRDEVLRRAETAGARVMLIRRPGRQTSSVCLMRSWCVVDPQAPAGERVTWGSWSYPAELLSGVERLEELVARDSARAEQGLGRQLVDGARESLVDEPLILVCTHGKKDPCCAVRGRPVAKMLAQRWPEQTWECSHTGGDRFAANVLLLPDGATYGSLDVESAFATIEAHRAGRPDITHLRGVTGHRRAVQAAVVAVHEQLGPLPWGSVTATGMTQRAPAEGEVTAFTVSLELADGRLVEVEVGEHHGAPAQLTCRSEGGKVSQVPVPGEVRFVS
ncbi:MAG: sucrase ferredoxin [Ornithinimicrobium sp.]|uniref:sucrase ferredoxin n=1 Tax=Ornithinimicrobium sp. TaxID=1977084 RepID=UPI0026DF3C91|nr:sucrase ferredoxin [Ornithinimicrobium sp.]MDO5740703.1 sucrase ferredoxin [Ornithinimicrobium sp.]